MSSTVLQVFALLAIVFVAFGDDIPDENHSVHHLSSENDSGIDAVHLHDNKETIEITDDNSSTEHVHSRTFTRPTTSIPIIRPTPTVATLPIETTTPTVTRTPPPRPIVLPTQVIPTIPIALPSPTPIELLLPLCGKKRNCYQWFDNDWELFADGYTRCESWDERRARRYCCIP